MANIFSSTKVSSLVNNGTLARPAAVSLVESSIFPIYRTDLRLAQKVPYDELRPSLFKAAEQL